MFKSFNITSIISLKNFFKFFSNLLHFKSNKAYLDFEREIITNELDNANIKKTKADIRKVEIDILLGLTGVIDDETIIKSICEQLDINYEDIKDKLPIDEVNNTLNAIDTLGGINE